MLSKRLFLIALLPPIVFTLVVVLNSGLALAQGTYSCAWDGLNSKCIYSADSCAFGSRPGDCSKFNNDLTTCKDPFAGNKQCVEGQREQPQLFPSAQEGGGQPKTPTPQTGTAGCKWEWANFTKQNGKCSTVKPQCGPDYESPSWLNCEGINTRGDVCDPGDTQKECLQKRANECKRLELGEVACVEKGEGGGPPRDKEGGGSPVGIFQIKNPLQFDTIPDILNAIAGFLYALALAVVTIIVLIGAFQILTAAGSPTQIDAGKRTLLWAVIGTVVILVAGGIADLTADILGGKTRSSPGSEIAGTAGCSWVKLEVGPGRCAPDLNCKSRYTAPSTLNCRADTQAECGAIPVKNCVEK